MKWTLRIPTADSYAYMETEVEGDVHEALAVYTEAIQVVKGGEGLDPKEFNAVLDEYLTTGKISGDPGVLSAMSIDQNSIIQAIKRSRARTNK